MDVNDEPISPYAPITTAAMQYLSYCDLSFQVNAHNNDRKQVSYNSSSITNLAIHCLHIHNPSSSWLKYNSTSHRAACDSGCGYSFYGTHYAQTPGTNVVCLGCGYVGNINQGST